jgi:hypothetical protein
MTNRSRGDGWPLIESQHGTRFALLSRSAISGRILLDAFPAWRFDSRRLRGLLRRRSFYGFSLGNRSHNRAGRPVQGFSRRERHCVLGIAIEVGQEDSKAACTRD